LLFPDGSALQDASPEFYIAWAGKAVGARLNRTVSRRPAISFYITSGSVQPSGAMVAGSPRRRARYFWIGEAHGNWQTADRTSAGLLYAHFQGPS
jgi:hypothetical protein